MRTILMYVSICVGVSILMSVVNSGGGSSFISTETQAAVISRDSSYLSQAFTDYVKEHSTVIDIGTSEKDLQDAVFERKVDAVFIIPEGFGADLMAGRDSQIQIKKVPDSAESHFIEMQYNRYLDLVKVYAASGFSEEEAARRVSEDLSSEIEVKLLDHNSTAVENLGNYYNFAAYGIMTSVIFGSCLSMIAFRRREVMNRTVASGIRENSVVLQMLAANLLYSLLVFLIFFILAGVIYRETAVSTQGLLMAVNAAVFTLCISTAAFFAGMLVRRREAASGITNVFSLGSSFLCGAFVPQAVLGDSVLRTARVLPAYWYVLSNDRLKTLSDTVYPDLTFFYRNLLILALFSAAFLTAALIVQLIRSVRVSS